MTLAEDIAQLMHKQCATGVDHSWHNHLPLARFIADGISTKLDMAAARKADRMTVERMQQREKAFHKALNEYKALLEHERQLNSTLVNAWLKDHRIEVFDV